MLPVMINNLYIFNFRCSELDFDLEVFKELLPSRCDLGLSFCQGTCHAIGSRDGVCDENFEVSSIFFYILWKKNRLKSTFLPYYVKKASFYTRNGHF